MALLASIRKVLAKHRIVKPIWNTEVNYGLVGGGGRRRAAISTERQVGNVIRTFVLNASSKVSRVYWYSWDLLGMSNTPMVEADRITLTPAGQAFSTLAQLAARRPSGRLHAGQDEHLDLYVHHRLLDPPGRVEPEQVGYREGAVAHQLGDDLERAPRTARAGTKVRVGVDPGDDQLSALTGRPAALSTLPG